MYQLYKLLLVYENPIIRHAVDNFSSFWNPEILRQVLEKPVARPHPGNNFIYRHVLYHSVPTEKICVNLLHMFVLHTTHSSHLWS